MRLLKWISSVHIFHNYYVVSDQVSWTGFRVIVERCSVCGKMRDSLETYW